MDALIHIKAGAGGEESKSFAFALQRMYLLWGQNNNLQAHVVYTENEGQDLVLRIAKSYEKLKNETGIHRRVRNSPLDPEMRRHTSFCSVNITPFGSALENGDIIRSYIESPDYAIGVRDHQSELEVKDLQSVFDGGLDPLLAQPRTKIGIPKEEAGIFVLEDTMPGPSKE